MGSLFVYHLPVDILIDDVFEVSDFSHEALFLFVLAFDPGAKLLVLFFERYITALGVEGVFAQLGVLSN
jgi:hypothetical protein